MLGGISAPPPPRRQTFNLVHIGLDWFVVGFGLFTGFANNNENRALSKVIHFYRVVKDIRVILLYGAVDLAVYVMSFTVFQWRDCECTGSHPIMCWCPLRWVSLYFSFIKLILVNVDRYLINVPFLQQVLWIRWELLWVRIQDVLICCCFLIGRYHPTPPTPENRQHLLEMINHWLYYKWDKFWTGDISQSNKYLMYCIHLELNIQLINN